MAELTPMHTYSVLFINRKEWDNPAVAYAPGSDTLSGLGGAETIAATTVQEAVELACGSFGIVVEDGGPVWIWRA